MLIKKMGLAMLLLLLVVTPVVCGAGAGPAVGKPSPNIMGHTLNDQNYFLKKDLDKPKVINFFSLSCKPCRQEMPELAKLEKQYPGVKFISVNTQPDKPEAVAKFVKSLSGAPSNIVLIMGELKEDFHFLGLPHTLVLDSDNIVLMNLVGYTPSNMRRLGKALQELTKQ